MNQAGTARSISLLEFIALMAMITSLTALAIDAVLPALALMGQDLGATSPQQTHLVVSLFFIGMAGGQLFFGPFADARGRRLTVLLGMMIFAVGSLICMYAPSMEVMLLGRIVQAFGAAGPRIATLAIIRDQYAGEAMARVMSFIMVVFIFVPMIAPIIGQFILQWGSWHSIFSFFVGFAIVVSSWFFLRQQETLLHNKRTPFRWQTMARSSRFILTHPTVMGFTVAAGFIFGAFLAYISAAQTLFQSIYQTGEHFPYYFALLAFAVGLASFTNGQFVMRFGMRRLCEYGLIGLIFCAALQLIANTYYAGMPPLWMFVSLLFISFFCIGILFGNLNAIAMQPLGNMAGLGAAIINSISGLMSVPIAILIGHFIHNTVTPISVGFLSCASIAFIVSRWVKWREPITEQRT